MAAGSELITGLDLVDWQLQIAAGGSLPKQQSELRCTGHAFEARIYAESPEKGFLPGSGFLAHLRPPAEVAGRRTVRVDTGVRGGDHVSVFYDPMIAKLIVHSEDRRKALASLAVALEDFQISGVPTNIPFLHTLATHPTFVNVGEGDADDADEFDIHFIDKNLESLMPVAGTTVASRDVALSAVAMVLHEMPAPAEAASLWEGGDGGEGWRPNGGLLRTLELRRGVSSGDPTRGVEMESVEVGVQYHGGGGFTVEVDGESFECRSASMEGSRADSSRTMRMTLSSVDASGKVQQQRLEAAVAFHGREVSLWVVGEHAAVPIVVEAAEDAAGGGAGGEGGGRQDVVAPMPGKVVRVLVSDGDT